MFEKLQREKTATVRIPTAIEAPVACAACDYVRKASDRNPAWECPGCGKAYARVEAANAAAKSFSQEKFDAGIRRESRQKDKQLLQGGAGVMAGIATFVSGMASSCTGSASNPWVQAVGVAIVVAAVGYGVAKYLV